MSTINSLEKIPPCIHGEVCRAYMREFGLQRVNGRLQCCIVSVHCPECRYYEPKSRDAEPHATSINVSIDV